MHPRTPPHSTPSAGMGIPSTHLRRQTQQSTYFLPPLHHSPTTLPSIHQLYPFLLPSGKSQLLHPAPAETPPHSYPNRNTSQSALAPPHEHDITAGSDYEGDTDLLPQRKRRRQALSCTGNIVCCMLFARWLTVLFRYPSFFTPFCFSYALPL